MRRAGSERPSAPMTTPGSPRACGERDGNSHQLAVACGFTLEPTKLNVEFAFWPRLVMATMQTTTIKASMTAYSTAVGPSSAFKNATSGRMKGCMVWNVWRGQGENLAALGFRSRREALQLAHGDLMMASGAAESAR